MSHLSQELSVSLEKVTVQTKFGPLSGRRAKNGTAVFLEIPYALPPDRFERAKPLPEGFKYEDKEYIEESAYGVQPTNDGQAAGVPPEDKLGLGKPTENPLFLNVVIPSSFNGSAVTSKKFPVKVYIHGGFLQFGSPHGLGGQAQYVAEEQQSIFVNVGYRLSAFGFLAAEKPDIRGNLGFWDQWEGLLWVKEHIGSFGGDVENIQLTGLSAGAHSVHQLLHHASRLPEGQLAPFHGAILQSNGIITTPKTPLELQPQFDALCTALSLDPASPNVLSTLQDPQKVPWQAIVKAIENLGQHGTFRGCYDPEWISVPPGSESTSEPDPMKWQYTYEDGFADNLRRVGVKSIIIGDMRDEWYLYALAHPVESVQDISDNLKRYYSDDVVEKVMELYGVEEFANGDKEKVFRMFGEILSDLQVHLPVRVLERDLIASGFPVVRYEVRWAPKALIKLSNGLVTHGMDRVLWAFRIPSLEAPEEVNVARQFLKAIDTALQEAEAGKQRDVKEVLTLTEEGSMVWREDGKYDEVLGLLEVLPE